MLVATAEPARLSASQLGAYQGQGFLVVPALFTAEEISEVSEEAERLLARADLIDQRNLRCRWQPRCPDGECLFETFDPVIDLSPVCARLARHPRLLAVLAGPIGEPETSVQQALTLLNGRFIAWATDPGRCPTLIAVTTTPRMSTAQRIEALYLSALSRKPTSPERERLLRHVARGGKDGEAERLADAYWMLLNSAEFRLNH